MKTKTPILAAGIVMTALANGFGATRYVDVNSASPTPPYTNWTTAATTIQDAVDAAVAGDQILVTNGVYHTGNAEGEGTNRVAVTKAVTLRSVNGLGVTVIVGDHAARCVFLVEDATLMGFTLTNGAADYGAGVYCASTGALVSNCMLTGNSAAYGGGGVFSGTLNNCTLSGNSAHYGGGALGSILNNCTISGNSALILNNGGGGGDGGGANFSLLNNCTITGNSAQRCGGGVCNTTLNNCMVTGNSADEGGGAGAPGPAGYQLNNCTVTGNTASVGGGAFGGKGGVTLNNCIVYYNVAQQEGDNYLSGFFNYSCTTPLPDGGGNITNAPLFVNQAAGNMRLQPNSPCINSGFNGFAPAGFDLDGNTRIAGGTVDIGAYEFQSPASVICYAWLQQYGLPTDGSADSTDADGDRLNNWQEWRAGTDPTVALSVLQMLSPTRGVSGLTVRWQSVSGRNYFLERGPDLGAQPPFSTLATDIVGQPGTTTFSDTNAVGPGPFFYRVGVSLP